MKQVNYTLTILLLTLICLPSYAQGVVNRSANRQTSSSKKANQKKTSSVKVSEFDGYINGHGYVDLGLPSGTKWATCNVGASRPEEFGDYFAWGETTTRKDYTENLSATFNKDLSTLVSEGIIDSNGILTNAHDAACTKWGKSWRSPTKEECEELVRECKWTGIKINGKYGAKITGPNKRSIFIPAAGFFADESGNLHKGMFVDVMCSEVRSDKTSSYYMCFSYGKQSVKSGRRSCGQPVRAVIK